MSKLLTRRRAMSISLAALLATPLSAQQSRWERIASTDAGSQIYLDIRTVSRPTRDVVIFWEKFVQPDRSEVKVHITMTRERLYKEDGKAWKAIQPESVIEAFYERLFR